MFLLGIVLALVGLSAAIDCPSGYADDGSGSCYTQFATTGDWMSAYYTCALDSGYMFDIQNAFVNTNIQQKASGRDTIWLSLTCLSNGTTSCQWGNGRTLKSGDYSNFYGGAPNVNACVVMHVGTGMWYSTDCATRTWFGCQYTPGVNVPSCADRTYSYFRGHCYREENHENINLDYARSVCMSGCGDIASVHSAGENNFVRDMVAAAGLTTGYTFTGLRRSGSSYYWTDGSSYDFSNFGYQNPNLGSCVSMAISDDVVAKGQWVDSQCSTTDLFRFVCKKDLATPCDVIATTMAAPTLEPLECTSPFHLTGYGNIYSPGYPRSSDANKCEYMITEKSDGFASIYFPELSLDRESYITLYNSIFDSYPFAVITNTKWNWQTYYSSTNILKVVYNTTGLGSNHFRGEYGSSSGESSEPPPMSTEVSPTELISSDSPVTDGMDYNCNGGDFYNDGYLSSPNYSNDYPPNLICEYLLHSDKNRITLTFVDFFTELNVDTVGVYDDAYWVEFAWLSGNQTGYNVTSYGPTMRVVLRTNESIQFRGFLAKFVSIY